MLSSALEVYFQVQWRDDLVLVKEGVVQHVVSGVNSSGVLPQIHSMTPVCVSNTQTGSVRLTGTNIAGKGQTVLCRSQGMQSIPDDIEAFTNVSCESER